MIAPLAPMTAQAAAQQLLAQLELDPSIVTIELLERYMLAVQERAAQIADQVKQEAEQRAQVHGDRRDWDDTGHAEAEAEAAERIASLIRAKS